MHFFSKRIRLLFFSLNCNSWTESTQALGNLMVFISVGNRIDNIYPFKAKLKTTVYGEQWRPSSVVGQIKEILRVAIFLILP